MTYPEFFAPPADNTLPLKALMLRNFNGQHRCSRAATVMLNGEHVVIPKLRKSINNLVLIIVASHTKRVASRQLELEHLPLKKKNPWCDKKLSPITASWSVTTTTPDKEATETAGSKRRNFYKTLVRQ